MNRIISYGIAGFIGGLVAFGGIQFVDIQTKSNNIVEHTNVAQQVNQTTSLNASVGPDFSMAAEKGMNAVVQINAQESDKLVRQNEERNNPFKDHPLFREFNFPGFGGYMPKKGSGSGVIYSSDGYIVTNNHVVEFADEIEVVLKDGKKYSAKKIGTDPRTDLAVLKIEATNLPVLQMANSDDLKIGSWVLAVGNPFGYLTSTVTAGIVSAKGRDLNLINNQMDDENPFSNYQQSNNRSNQGIEEFIQTDAAVNPGNSGGALVDEQGRLLGINSAIASKTGYYSGYSFAIPVNLMNKVVKELISKGSFNRGRLGISVSEIDENSFKELNLFSKDGVIIESLEENSSAKYAGLQEKDAIIGINGKDVKNYDDLQRIVGLTKVGETLNIKIIRNGSVRDIPFKILKGI